MGKRHETIGIKQAIRLEWMQKTANLVLAGLDAKAIRQELHEFLADRRGHGTEVERSEQTRAFAVNNLMHVWVLPDPELIPFRDASLAFLRGNPSMAMAIHWGMISAVYPFWFNIARQTGRLLALQDQVTQAQIINRLKEQYGDRQTVSRYARFVIRSFVAWGAIKDSDTNGCYEKGVSLIIIDTNLVTLMIEAVLLSTPEPKIILGLLNNNPALFPFELPVINSGLLMDQGERMEVIRYGLDDELVALL